MALVDRINTMNGLSNVAATVTQLLNNEAPAYIRYIPDDLVRQFTTASTDNGTDGVSLNSGRFVYAHKDGRRAVLVDGGRKADVLDSGSMRYATAFTPAAYVENGKVYVKPGGGTVIAVLASTLNSSSDDAISFLPAPLSDAVQIKVAWRLLAYAIFGNTAPYDRPVAPTIEYVPAGFAEMASVAMAGVPNAPVYTAPTIAAGFATQILVSMGNIPSAPVYTPPAIDVAFASKIAITMGSIPSAPVYTPPALSGSFATAMSAASTALTNDDVEVASGQIAVARNYLEDYSLKVQNASNEFQSTVSKFRADVEKLIKDVDVAQNSAALYLQKYSSDVQVQAAQFQSALAKFEADIQKLIKDVDVALEKSRIFIAQYQADIANQQNVLQANTVKFNGDMTKLQGDLQALIEKYRLDAQQETNVDLQNQIQKAQTELQNYSLSLQRYQGQIQSGLQMLAALWAQHEAILASYVRPDKSMQKTSNVQPVEAV